ncbi:MAG TPA: hypothetical protein VMF30_08025, partial [Pirellulales bacterium]|nr:hypothetical protein [Pirellulales bacterium]
MKTAAELFHEFVRTVRAPKTVAALFAADGVLELPYVADLALPWQYTGREAIAGLFTRLLELVPGFEFCDVVIQID